jgi:peptidoglycan/LPS O-acetylase OafA/YrhL
MTTSSPERLHALDAVRGFALIAGIIFHATVSFLPGPPGVPLWLVMDNSRSLVLAVLFHVLHTFRMTIFFLIAGFFAHMSFHRLGARGFIRDRLKRIALPLVVGWPILFAAIIAVTFWAAIVMAHGKPLPPPPKYPGLPAFPLTHLWFLYVLLLLYAGTLALSAVMALVNRGDFFGRGADWVVRGIVTNPLGAVVLAIPTCATLFFYKSWPMWFGIPTPDSSLIPNGPAAVAFGTAFGFGWLVHRQPQLIEIWRGRWALYLAAAAILSAAGLYLIGPAPGLLPTEPSPLKLGFDVLYALAIWAWTFGLVGGALRFLSGYSATRRYIADASYWLYLIHLPLIVALQVLVSQAPWPWFVKFPLILAIAFPLMFASYQAFVRYTFVGAILNGRRRPRRAPDTLDLPLSADAGSKT